MQRWKSARSTVTPRAAIHKFASWNKCDLLQLLLTRAKPPLTNAAVNAQCAGNKVIRFMLFSRHMLTTQRPQWTALHFCVDMRAHDAMALLLQGQSSHLIANAFVFNIMRFRHPNCRLPGRHIVRRQRWTERFGLGAGQGRGESSAAAAAGMRAVVMSYMLNAEMDATTQTCMRGQARICKLSFTHVCTSMFKTRNIDIVGHTIINTPYEHLPPYLNGAKYGEKSNGGSARSAFGPRH